MVPKPKFKPGDTVEVSIDRGGGVYGSWFTATIIRWISSDKILIQYRYLYVAETVVRLHQIRPVPTPDTIWELKSGDKVEAFRKLRGWEGHVVKDLENGKFSVRFTDSEKFQCPKYLLRVPRQWINQTWVPPITLESIQNYKKLKMAMKRDIISELPDTMLLHIMSFLETRDACILSKRWKDLCKRLTTLIYTLPRLRPENRVKNFKRFKCWVISTRDQSCPLLNLTIETCFQENEKHLYKLVKHALSNNLQHLKITMHPTFKCKSKFSPLILASHSLTFLHLSGSEGGEKINCPKSLRLPALRTLHLECVSFVATDNHYADPFSNCTLLDVLVLRNCCLNEDAQVFCISNHTLSSLTVFCVETHQLCLSTPNLSSFTILDHSVFYQRLSSTCDLSLLHQVNINSLGCRGKLTNLLTWLQVLATNVKILTFNDAAVCTILYDLEYPTSKKAQPPCFERLESLTVFLNYKYQFHDDEIFMLADHLFQNTTPIPKVYIRISR
ncbi:uncharacterized protein LOC131604400 [Vicia villosa]|uniref:uncharacterized protein LOC131604400 n=1 Tax=Vicia villosa TaxID=3911 RepID=UPI00273B4945|nr:uncharacterized protein LOC131604400 [Vicia villosa]